MSRFSWDSSRWVVLAACCAVLLSLYFYRVAYWPGFDFDELGFLNIPFRFVEFGDLRYPVMLDAEGFGSEPVRKYPPIVAGLLRSSVHFIVGFSATASRALSGLMVVGSALLAAMLMMRMGVPVAAAALALLLIALQPSVLIAARTVRLEQEIVFLSIVALAVPLLIGRRLPRTAWALSGLAAACAGLSHPWGLSIGVGLLFTLMVFQRVWRQHDGVPWLSRLGFIAIGAALPTLSTLYQVFHDWPAFREYVSAQAALYAVRNVQNIGWFAAANEGSLAFRMLPAYWAAKVHEIDLYAMIVPAGYRWAGIFAALLWAQLAIVTAFFVAIPLIVSRQDMRPSDLPPFVFAAGTMGVIGMFLLYPPSTNYFAYPAILAPAATTLILAWCWRERRRFAASRLFGLGSAVVVGLAALATAHVTAHMIGTMRRTTASVPLDSYLAAQNAMGRRLGFKTTEKAFCDMATWMACGRGMRSGLQAVIFGLTRIAGDADAASFHQPLLGALVDTFPSFTTPLSTAAEKTARLQQLTSGLQLAGIIRVPHGVDLFYTRGVREADGLSAVELGLDGLAANWHALPLAKPGCSWRDLEAGRYLLVTPDTSEGLPTIRTDDGRSFPWIGGRHLERLAFVDLAGRGAIDACGGRPTDIRLFRLLAV